MEKGKKKNNTTKKSTTKKPVKKIIAKKNNKKNNKKGLAFTLIELLAVIVILGILMLVAIPSVTNYINNSRKSAYIDTANQYIKGVTVLVNSGALDVYDIGTTYYVPTTCVALETGGESPYGGKFDPAYVVVTYNNDSYSYYWISRDGQGMGIDKVTSSNKLTTDLVKAGVSKDKVNAKYGVDGRDQIVLFSEDCSSRTTEEAGTSIDGTTGNEIIIKYPSGKTKETVEVGDSVKIGTEEFYVLGYNATTKKLRLFAKYNVNVGPKKNPNVQEGIQHSSIIGRNRSGSATYAEVAFSGTNYWDGKVGTVYPGNYSGSPNNTVEPFVFDSNSNLYQYTVAYKNYLESFDVAISSVTLLTHEDLKSLGCGQFSCTNAPAFLSTTSYWTGTAANRYDVFRFSPFDGIAGGQHNRTDAFGFRPVVVI